MSFNYKKHISPQVPLPAINVPEELNKQLGRGMKVPFDLITPNRWDFSSGIDKVQQSMFIILLTPIGRRYMQPDFGSMLPRLLFEHYTTTLKGELEDATKGALKRWYNRVITVENCTVDLFPNQNNGVMIVIEYTIKGTMARDTLSIGLTRPDTIEAGPAVFTINGRRVFVG